MTFTIGCEVSGGVTGYRTSELKKDGEIMEFETRAEAEKHLPKSRTTERGVTFRYWIRENA